MQEPSSERTVALVVNEGARRGAGALARSASLLRTHGVQVTASHSVDSHEDLVARLDEVLADDPDVVVVGGGDGSLSCAADKLAHRRSALGVLPLGTANDLARTLQVPTSLPRACHVIAHGDVVDVDLGCADDQVFVNAASAGLSVGVTEFLDRRLKRGLGRAAYGVALLRAYRHHRPFTARLEFPDGDHEDREWHDLLQVAVGNGRHHGGGNAVAPAAGIDDGTLNVYAIRSAGVREHVRIATALKDGSFVSHPSVEHIATGQLRLVTEPATPLNLDGEVSGRTPTSFRVDRNALRVVIPRSSDAARLDEPD